MRRWTAPPSTSGRRIYRIASLQPVVNGNYILSLKDGTEMRMTRMYAGNVLGSPMTTGADRPGR